MSNYGGVQTGTHPAGRGPGRRSIQTHSRPASLLRDEGVNAAAAVRLCSQPSSLGTGRPRTAAHVGGHGLIEGATHPAIHTAGQLRHRRLQGMAESQ